MFATGIDLRREGYRFNGDRRTLADRSPIYGAPFDDGNTLDDVHRDIKALFVEALVPVFDNMDVNLAARYDHYSGFGGTTNVGVGVQYQPWEVLLFRGAYSTGFRAPSFNQLFNGVSERPYTGSDLADPAACPNGVVNVTDPDCQPVSPVLVFGGKQDLGPEESKQSSFGLVWSPISELSVNLDWWEILTEGNSQAPTLDELLVNSGSYAGNFIRDNQGNLTAIDMRYINAGERNTSGVEVGVQVSGLLAAGVWGLNLNASYLIEDKKKLLDGGPFGDNMVGYHSRGNIPLRWKHSVAVDYAQGDWRYTLLQIYRDGYEDEVPAGVQSGAIAIDSIENYSSTVASYLIYNVNVAYRGFGNLDVAFGVKNLFDRDPPFTAHQNDYSPGAAFDPRIASARGRAYTFHAEYRF
jgi:iron complex outermembrane receptor protein